MIAMRSRKVLIAAILAGCAVARSASGEPAPSAPQVPGLTYLHILSSFDGKTTGGSELHLPPGFFLDEPSFKKLDDAFKAKADDDTRLTAENKALKADMSGWQPGWYTLATALAVGLVGGWYLHDKL